MNNEQNLLKAVSRTSVILAEFHNLESEMESYLATARKTMAAVEMPDWLVQAILDDDLYETSEVLERLDPEVLTERQIWVAQDIAHHRAELEQRVAAQVVALI